MSRQCCSPALCLPLNCAGISKHQGICTVTNTWENLASSIPGERCSCLSVSFKCSNFCYPEVSKACMKFRQLIFSLVVVTVQFLTMDAMLSKCIYNSTIQVSGKPKKWLAFPSGQILHMIHHLDHVPHALFDMSYKDRTMWVSGRLSLLCDTKQLNFGSFILQSSYQHCCQVPWRTTR